MCEPPLPTVVHSLYHVPVIRRMSNAIDLKICSWCQIVGPSKEIEVLGPSITHAVGALLHLPLVDRIFLEPCAEFGRARAVLMWQGFRAYVDPIALFLLNICHCANNIVKL